MICKNIPRDHSWRAVVSFLRSYRLTGRLTVFFILVKPFADVVCGYVYHDQENEFSYDLHGIPSLLAVISRGQHSNYIMIII